MKTKKGPKEGKKVTKQEDKVTDTILTSINKIIDTINEETTLLKMLKCEQCQGILEIKDIDNRNKTMSLCSQSNSVIISTKIILMSLREHLCKGDENEVFPEVPKILNTVINFLGKWHIHHKGNITHYT